MNPKPHNNGILRYFYHLAMLCEVNLAYFNHYVTVLPKPDDLEVQNFNLTEVNNMLYMLPLKLSPSYTYCRELKINE